MSDFYRDAAARRMELLQAERAAATADLQAAKSNGDYDGAASAVQQLADLDAAAANLGNLYSRHVQSQTPAAPEQLSAEEQHAKPWSRMTPQDALELARGSRYGKNLDFNDPHVRAGWAEANRRKARGE